MSNVIKGVFSCAKACEASNKPNKMGRICFLIFFEFGCKDTVLLAMNKKFGVKLFTPIMLFW